MQYKLLLTNQGAGIFTACGSLLKKLPYSQQVDKAAIDLLPQLTFANTATLYSYEELKGVLKLLLISIPSANELQA